MIAEKNAQNVLILLRTRFKRTSHEKIKQSILRCDTNMLDADFIDELIKSLPKLDYIQQLRKLKSDGVKLIDVEEFLASLCDIDRLLPRLRCMKIKGGFDDMSRKVEFDIKAVMVACKEVVTCQKFHKILRFILSIGNFMNAGSNIGHAAAFELPSLANLNDVKSTDNRQTLVHFLVETIEENSPDLLNFGDELIHVHEATHVNTNDVDKSINEIVESLEFIKTEIESANEFHPASDDTFIHEMSSFTSKCHAKLQELVKMKEYMDIRCIEVADFFSFEITKYPIAECFKDIETFKGLFAQKSMEIAKRRESVKMKRLFVQRSMEITKRRESEKMKVRAPISHQKMKGRAPIPHQRSGNCRDCIVKIHRLSRKGLCLYFCIIAPMIQVITFKLHFTFTYIYLFRN